MPEPITTLATTLFSNLLQSDFLRWIVTETLQFWRTSRFVGTYSVIYHEGTLELLDTDGSTARYTKRQQIHFLQDNVFAIQDQAWGDGEIFADYTCHPGIAVDRYEEGHRWKVLISLRTTKNKGESEDILIERTIKNGYTENTNNFSTTIDHPTKSLKIAVMFPETRLPKSIYFLEQNARRSKKLTDSNSSILPQGRVGWSVDVAKPHLFEEYSFRWEW